MSYNTNYTAQWRSSLSFFEEPDVYDQLFDIYREAFLFNFSIYGGAKGQCHNTQFNWHEDSLLRRTLTIESFTGGASPGAAAVITLEEADHTGSGAFSPPVVGQSVMIHNSTSGVTKGQITAVNKSVADAHTITVVPDVATVQLDAVIANADIVSVYSNAQVDGASTPGSETRLPVERLGYTQIFWNVEKLNGSVAANKIEFQINGQYYYIIKSEQDNSIRHINDIEAALIFNGAPVQGSATTPFKTEGLEGAIDTRGNTETYATLGFGDLENMVNTLDLFRAPDQHLGLVGTRLMLDIEDLLRDSDTIGGGGGLDFSNFGDGNAAANKVDLGIRSWVIGGRTFGLKKFNPFMYRGYFADQATSAAPYSEMALFIPIGKTADPVSGDRNDYIELCYKQGPMQERWMDGWKRDKHITGEDTIEFNYFTECGLRARAAEHMIKLAK